MGMERNKRVHFRRNAGAFGENDFESRRHDANDRGGPAVEAHGPANEVRVGAITPAPKTIAEDCHERRARSFLARKEQASQLRPRPKNAEETGCHHPELDVLRLALAR